MNVAALVNYCLTGEPSEDSKANEVWQGLVNKFSPREQRVAATNMRCTATLKDGNTCGSNRIRIDTAQTRSADEGQSCFYTCADCGHSWHVAS